MTKQETVDVAERIALKAAEVAAVSQVSYEDAVDALMRASGYVPAWERVSGD